MKIFSGSNSEKLAEEISTIVGTTLGRIQIDRFSDGEILPLFRESVRGEDVFFITNTSSSDLIVETLLVIDAAKRSGCKSFTLVSPYMGYSRQDKSDHLRSSIGSKVLADILEKVGMTCVISVDLHASAIQGFYSVPVIHLNGNKIFISHIRNLGLENICILAPDQGAVKRASDFCKSFPDATFAMINKKRIKPNEIHSMELVGYVVGKNVIVVDDISDTLGTLKKASDLIMDSGALSVRAITTHGILSGNAISNLDSSRISELFISDTIIQEKRSKKVTIVSCAGMISKSIIAISEKKSINEINQV